MLAPNFFPVMIKVFHETSTFPGNESVRSIKNIFLTIIHDKISL